MFGILVLLQCLLFPFKRWFFVFSFVGFKFVILGNPYKRKCNSMEYQPFTFSTNGSSTCILKKMHCSEEGQIIINNGSTTSNSQCRCDYTRGYDFITKPHDSCNCEPSMEDCLCYHKRCTIGFRLSPGKRLITMLNFCNFSMFDERK